MIASRFDSAFLSQTRGGHGLALSRYTVRLAFAAECKWQCRCCSSCCKLLPLRVAAATDELCVAITLANVVSLHSASVLRGCCEGILVVDNFLIEQLAPLH